MNKKEIMDVFDWFFEDTGNLNYDADYLAEKYIDSRKQAKNIAYEPVLPTVFERGDVIMFCDEHYFVIENNGANGVVAPFGETCYLNTFWWELGDDKCTFVRKSTEKELSMLGLNGW
jgi:hypothetical protein